MPGDGERLAQFINPIIGKVGDKASHWAEPMIKQAIKKAGKVFHHARNTVLYATLSLFVSEAIAEIQTSILVPDANGAAKVIYDEVISGIASHADLNISIIRLTDDTTATDIASQIEKNASEIVISIGNKGYNLVKEKPFNAIVVAGGISGKSNDIPTLSLTAAPETTLKELKDLAPAIPTHLFFLLLKHYDEKIWKYDCLTSEYNNPTNWVFVKSKYFHFYRPLVSDESLCVEWMNIVDAY